VEITVTNMWRQLNLIHDYVEITVTNMWRQLNLIHDYVEITVTHVLRGHLWDKERVAL
jgi:hypothetical protein